MRTLKANSTCNALDLSGDGSNVVVSGHQDGSVRLWDLSSGAQVAEASAVHGTGQVTSVAFSPRGGMQILSAGRDNALRLLDARSLNPTLSITHSALRIGYNWCVCRLLLCWVSVLVFLVILLWNRQTMTTTNYKHHARQ